MIRLYNKQVHCENEKYGIFQVKNCRMMEENGISCREAMMLMPCIIQAKIPETSKEYLPHASFSAVVVRDVLTSDVREHT